MRRMNGFANGRASGFTLIETLVAMVVLSVGLLGALAMLLGGLRDHADSRRETEAIGLLSDVAHRLRANVAACTASVPAPCAAATLTAIEVARLQQSANVLYPGGEPIAAIEFVPATGAAPDRYVITLSLPYAAGADVLRLQVHTRTPVAG
jgi:prepilin-type N-terminal cleavage/methylation domain-containing protein